jgi:hypothetical protein
MIKVGDIVFKRRRGGFIHDKPHPVTNEVGLVIKEYHDKGAIPQYYVQFDQKDPRWFYKHELHKIEWGERNEND